MEIYLDNSATTRVSPQAAALVGLMMTENYGNPSSLHHKGFVAEQAVTAARTQVANVLGARGDEILFTTCGSDANSLALLGAARALRHNGNKIVTTAIEHASVLAAAAVLEREGFQVTYLAPGPDGTVSPQAVADAVDQNTILVSVMQVNSETGAIHDLAAIAGAAKRNSPKILMHSDCVQGFCRLPVTPARWGVDLVTVSGHKIHAPKGIAALYRRKGIHLQQDGLHQGTENTPAICAMGLAAQTMWAARAQNQAQYRTLHQLLTRKILEIPGLCINSPPDGALHIMNLSLPDIRSEVMIHYLEQFEIYVSSGSACSRGAKSHVLTAMGLSADRIDGALRISFCPETTAMELEELALHLAEGCRTLARKQKIGTRR